MLPPDLLRCEAALTRHQLSGHHRSSLRQPERRGSAAGPSVRETARRCAAAPSAASPRPGRSKLRSSRHSSQRTRAHNAWKPTLGTSPISVNLSEVLSMGYRAELPRYQGSALRHGPFLSPHQRPATALLLLNAFAVVLLTLLGAAGESLGMISSPTPSGPAPIPCSARAACSTT